MNFSETSRPKRLDLSGINTIFWGLMLVFLDFRINNFDLLPDFLGFIIVLVGLMNLSSLSGAFIKAKPYAAVSLILSLPDLYNISFRSNYVPGWFWIYIIVVGLISLYVNIMLYFYIISGIKEVAAACGSRQHIERGDKIFTRVSVIRGLNYLAGPILLLLGDAALIPMLALIIVSLVIEITFLVYLRNTYKTLNGREIGPYDANAE